MDFDCRDCKMRFRTPKELENHKTRFCVGSLYHDPVKLQDHLHRARQKRENDGQSLADIRQGFMTDEEAQEKLRRELTWQLEQQRIDQLKRLQTEAALVRQAKESSEKELLTRMQALEEKTAAELRARDEKEHMRRQLYGVDRARLNDLETEKRRQVEAIERERDQLRQREEAAQRELMDLQTRISAQEEQHRSAVEKLSSAITGLDARKQAEKKDALRDLARKQGEQMARLRSQRDTLEKERERLRTHVPRTEFSSAPANASSEQPTSSDLDELPQRDQLNSRYAVALENINTMKGNTKAALEHSIAAGIGGGAKANEVITRLQQQQLEMMRQRERFIEERQLKTEAEERLEQLQQDNKSLAAQLEELQQARLIRRPSSAKITGASPRSASAGPLQLDTAVPVLSHRDAKSDHGRPHSRGSTPKPLPLPLPSIPHQHTLMSGKPLAHDQILEEINRLSDHIQKHGADSASLARLQQLEAQLGGSLQPTQHPAPPPQLYPSALPLPSPAYAPPSFQPAAGYAGMPMQPMMGMGMDPSMPPWLAQQIMMVQSQLAQSESENKRLVDELRLLEERRRDSKANAHTREFEKALAVLANKVGGKAPVRRMRDDDSVAESDRQEESSTMQEADDLKQLRLEHDREMAKMKFEMERLQGAQQLERLKHEMEQEKQKLEANESENTFCVFWDFAIGLPAEATQATVVYAVYDEEQPKTSVRRTTLCDCQFGYQRCLINQQRVFANVAQQPRLKVVMEVQCVLTTSGGKPVSVGWTLVEMYDAMTALREGHWQVPLYRGVPMPKSLVTELNTFEKVDGGGLFLRIVRAADRLREGRASFDQVGLYNTPPYLLQPGMYTSPISQRPPPAIPHAMMPMAQPHLPFTMQITSPQPLVAPKDQTPPRRLSKPDPYQPSGLLPYQLPQGVGTTAGALQPTVTAAGLNLPRASVISSSYKDSRPQTSGGLPGAAPTAVQPYGVLAPPPEIFYSPDDGFGILVENTVSFGRSSPMRVSVIIYNGMVPAVRPGTGGQYEWVTTSQSVATFGKVEWRERVLFSTLAFSPAAYAVFELFETREDGKDSAIAWTCCPVFATMSTLQAPRLNVGRLELSLYKQPVLVPPTQPARQGTGKLVAQLFYPHAPPQLANATQAAMELSAIGLPQSAWTAQKVEQMSYIPYKAGDGFDVYIDSVRHLPENIALSHVMALVLTRDASPVGERFSKICSLSGPTSCPMFNLRQEFRQPEINSTATLYLQVSGTDRVTGHTLKAIGFATLNLFVDATGMQPAKHPAADLFLNVGAFQLRLYRKRLLAGAAISASSFADFPEVLCTTVLIRIVPAARTPDKTRFLTLSDITEPGAQAAAGLVVPAPHYVDGIYDSSACEPNENEKKIFATLLNQPNVTVKQTCINISSELQQPDPLTGVEPDTAFEAWLQKRFAGVSFNTELMDFNFAFKYNEIHGLKISVEMARNLPVSKALTKAIYSLSPPGAFYFPQPLTATVDFTLKNDLDSPIKHPKWADGWKLCKDAFNPYTIMIIELRGMTPATPSWKMAPIGFAVIPVFSTTGHVLSGVFQVPIFEGEFNKTVFERCRTERAGKVLNELTASKVLRPVQWASLFVRILDMQRDGELDNWKEEDVNMLWLPAARVNSYVSMDKSPPQVSILPKGMDREQMLKITNQQFATATQIDHYDELAPQ
eukprot:TRINITY_DN2141_c0_g1_i1.p1 TRINITY_DN2141_c0_g1~~TRINITY_DN2141_c0_g1_i1.p1  ORF type:complete len:1681 (+),score=407.84 TRINITY_DN2141_c0_g1_i1:101-5143(+)